MTVQLVSKAEFGRLHDVLPSQVTRLIQGELRSALIGKKIDLAHPLVEKWKQRLDNLRGKNAQDPLYLDAVEACRVAGVISTHVVRKATKVGHNRATKLVDMMALQGIDVGTVAPVEEQAGARRTPPAEIPPTNVADTQYEPPASSLAIIDEHVRPYLRMPLEDIILKFGTLPQFKTLLDARKSIEDIRQKQLKSEEVEGRSISKSFVQSHFFGLLGVTQKRLLTDTPKAIAVHLKQLVESGASIVDMELAVHDAISSQLAQAQQSAVQKLKELEQ
jgi:hypothetical protein